MNKAKEKIDPKDRSAIAQQDPNAEDTQAHIKENARKGEPHFVENSIGHKPITEKVVPEK